MRHAITAGAPRYAFNWISVERFDRKILKVFERVTASNGSIRFGLVALLIWLARVRKRERYHQLSP